MSLFLTLSLSFCLYPPYLQAAEPGATIVETGVSGGPAERWLTQRTDGSTAKDLTVPDNPPIPALAPAATEKSALTIVRVGLLDSGVNYTLPEIHQRLARDARGELIGYDFWDLDPYPFDAHPTARGSVQRHGTQTASLILKEASFVELVPYRYPRPDMARMWSVVEHADHHDVRIIGMPLGGNRADQWQHFAEAANAHPHILFIASAGNNGRDIDQRPVYPASLTLENMLVVTSADDFGRLAPGSNWGRSSVDYLVPAENQLVTRFSGESGRVSGSSYAVSRVVALAARLLRDRPAWTAPDLIREIRRRFANGSWPSRIAQGYLYDPMQDDTYPVQMLRTQVLPGTISASDPQSANRALPIEILILDSQWTMQGIDALLAEAQSILGQCQVAFDPVIIKIVTTPDYMKDLDIGPARTLFSSARADGPERKLTVVLARDTNMAMPFDAEAFGQGNTRYRPWMEGSVWLTLALQDRAIALAHEIMHVLMNSGEHSDDPTNLMFARTSGDNTNLDSAQCERAVSYASERGWID